MRSWEGVRLEEPSPFGAGWWPRRVFLRFHPLMVGLSAFMQGIPVSDVVTAPSETVVGTVPEDKAVGLDRVRFEHHLFNAKTMREAPGYVHAFCVFQRSSHAQTISIAEGSHTVAEEPAQEDSMPCYVAYNLDRASSVPAKHEWGGPKRKRRRSNMGAPAAGSTVADDVCAEDTRSTTSGSGTAGSDGKAERVPPSVKRPFHPLHGWTAWSSAEAWAYSALNRTVDLWCLSARTVLTPSPLRASSVR